MPTRRARLLSMALLAGLAACGGGGNSSLGSAPSNATIRSVSANGAVMPNDSTEAMAVALGTAQAVVAAGPASATVSVACAGGGSARYTVTGPLTTIANGALDAGETFAITLAGCQGTAGAAAVTGSMTLAVISASTATLRVSTTTSNLSVALPLRTVTLNGSSTLTQTKTSSGNNTTTSNHWTSPSIQVKSQRSSTGTSRFDLRNVDYTRSIVAVNGVPVRSSCQGGSTLDADLAFFTWFVTLAIIDPVVYDATGAVVQGTWLIALPDARITLTIGSQRISVTVDLGANGTINLNFPFDPFFDEAG